MPVLWLDVFFWALVATVSLYVGMAVFTSRQRFSRAVYMAAGMLASIGYFGPRLLIPFLPQPALGLPDGVALLLGAFILFAGVGIMIRVILRLRATSEGGAVLDDGLFGLVRHPMYLGDVLWSLGLGLMLNAVYAVALVPLWWLLRACLSVLEEERLVDKYGEAYRAYQGRVPCRMLPLPRRGAGRRSQA
ncbi:MAG: methyltransferase family protein [Halorhodospira sp.]